MAKRRGNLLKGEPRFVEVSNSKDRVKQYRLRQKELGRLKREFYLTDTEWIEAKAFIEQLRKPKSE